jgi:hypothetical protein
MAQLESIYDQARQHGGLVRPMSGILDFNTSHCLGSAKWNQAHYSCRGQVV